MGSIVLLSEQDIPHKYEEDGCETTGGADDGDANILANTPLVSLTLPPLLLTLPPLEVEEPLALVVAGDCAGCKTPLGFSCISGLK